MANPYQPNPRELAQLVALLIQRYSAERGKEVSRFRLARRTLRKIAARPALRDPLIDKWTNLMLAEQGWLVFADAEDFLLLKSEAPKGWTKVATKRIDDLLGRLATGDRTAIKDLRNELKPLAANGDAPAQAAAE